MEDHREGGKTEREEIREGDKHERLWILETKLRLKEGRGMGYHGDGYEEGHVL